MIVKLGDGRNVKISFKHTSRFPPENPDLMGKSSEVLLPATVFGLGGKKKFRGMTMCFLSLVEEGKDPQPLTEGMALCAEEDQYRKEDGRQYSLFHALRMKTSDSWTNIWILDEDAPFNRADAGRILGAYFGRPRNKPSLTKMIEERANQIIEEMKKNSNFEQRAREEDSQPITAASPEFKEVMEETSKPATAGE